MAFEGLSDRLEAAFKKLRSKGSLTEGDVKEAMREVRLALLEADVNYKVAKDFTNNVTERAVGEKVMDSLKRAAIAVHVADVRTCVLHPASMTHRQLSEAEQIAAGVSPDLIRVSVGIENIDDIIADFDQALKASC